MRKIVLAATLSLSVLAGGALAQTAPSVSVAIGEGLSHRADEFGSREVNDLRRDLGDEISHALKHNANIARVDLIIEDAAPNRPTFEQLGRTIGLSLRSIGVGGARISGAVTMVDGSVRPVRFQWYETDIRDERGASTWFDADRSFSFLASELRSGRVPDRYSGPGPTPNGGHFGYPFRGQ